METFCWYVLLKKDFVEEICSEVVWASLKNLCEMIGSPYNSILFNRKSVKNKFVHGKSRQTRSRTKKRKNCNHWEGNTANSFLSKRKRCETILSKKTPVKNSLTKNNEVNLKNWGTQENKLAAMVTPWKKMLSGNPLKPVSLLKSPKTFFIQEKSTKENFVHRKTTEVDFFQGKSK